MSDRSFPLWSGEIKPSPPYTGEVFLSSGTFSLTGFLDALPKRDPPNYDEPYLDEEPLPKDSRDKIPDLINRLLTAIDAEIARTREACCEACAEIAGGGPGGATLKVPKVVSDPFSYMVGRSDAAAAIRNRGTP
jgi:hypothetical protein